MIEGSCGPVGVRSPKSHGRGAWRVTLVFGSMLALCAGASVADAQHPWRIIDNETVVAKKTCIRTDDVTDTDAGVSAWVRDTYDAAQRLADGHEFSTARAELLVRCDAQRWRVLRVVAYDARGAAVLDDAGPDGRWHDLRAPDGGSELARGVCSVAAVKRQWAAAATLR